MIMQNKNMKRRRIYVKLTDPEERALGSALEITGQTQERYIRDALLLHIQRTLIQRAATDEVDNYDDEEKISTREEIKLWQSREAKRLIERR